MGIQEWLIFAGIVISIATGFAIPFGIWMAKMWASQQVLANSVNDVNGRLTRVETEKINTHTAIFNQIGAVNDRVNEHAQQMADHGARISNNEGEIKNLRTEVYRNRGGQRG